MKKRRKYEEGGKIGDELAGVQGLPELLTAITSMITDKPTYDSQPLVTGQALRNMKTPYSAAYGLDLGGGGGKKRKSKARKEAEDINIPSINYRNGMQFTGAVDDSGLTIEDPSQAQWLDTMIKYALNNNPDSNVYRDAFQHHSIVDKGVLPTVAAFGADLGDEDLDQLQTMADQQGITIEELIEQLQAQQGEDEEEYVDDTEEEEEYSYGGKVRQEYGSGGTAKHWIQKAVNPKHKGYCTPMTKSTCTPRRKALARTFKKHHGFHALGGQVPIEVEDNEVVQTPDGSMQQMNGATHEEGGIDINVPDGTRIYSDRLSIDGKTMQQRKKAREGRLIKMNKALGINPSDTLVKNSIARTSENNAMEEEQDMAFQKMAAKIYDAPTEKAAYGKDTYQSGGEKYDPFGLNPDGLLPNLYYGPGTRYMPTPISTASTRDIGVSVGGVPNTAPRIPIGTPDAIPEETNLGYTMGDLIGVGGNLFNAIAPIINTRNAAKNTRPVVNRFKGFGRDALDTNTFAQTYADIQRGNELRDLDSTINAQVAGARNSARGVNTLRSLETGINLSRNKAKNAINANATNKMLNILGQRTQLENMRDTREMQGQTQADVATDMNLDNYYSNLAQNLTNAGTNIEGLGRNLNVTQGNNDAAELMALMTKNNIKIGRRKGKLVLLNN